MIWACTLVDATFADQPRHSVQFLAGRDRRAGIGMTSLTMLRTFALQQEGEMICLGGNTFYASK